jgi:hypothetical protein
MSGWVIFLNSGARFRCFLALFAANVLAFSVVPLVNHFAGCQRLRALVRHGPTHRAPAGNLSAAPSYVSLDRGRRFQKISRSVDKTGIWRRLNIKRP